MWRWFGELSFAPVRRRFEEHNYDEWSVRHTSSDDGFLLTLACHHEATVAAFHRFDRAPGPKTHNDIYNIETMTAEQTQQPP